MKSRTHKLLALVAALALGLSACGTSGIPECHVGGIFGMFEQTFYEGDAHPDKAGYACEADGQFHPSAATTDGNPSSGGDYSGGDATAPEPANNGTCSKDALTASHDDNLSSGRYEMSYFGGTSEACYIFGEFNFGYARQSWLIVVPPGYTFNLAGFIGETTWYRESDGAVEWSIEDSTANLTRKDGRNEKSPIVVWVNDPATLKLLPKEAKFEVIPPASK